MAILKDGSRQPLKDETKEAIAQRKHQALEGLRAIFSEIGLDEKGESTRFSTRNEKYVALKVCNMYPHSTYCICLVYSFNHFSQLAVNDV